MLIQRHSKQPQKPVLPSGGGFCFAGLASDFYLLELFEGGFYFREIKAADAPDFDHRNYAGACPVAEASARDV